MPTRLAASLPALALSVLAAPALAQPAAQSPTGTTAEVVTGEPRYLGAMRSELEAMHLAGIECVTVDPTRGTCTFRGRGLTTNRDFDVRMVYSDETDTIYLFIHHYLSAPDDAPSTPRVLRRLMELNWSLLLAKFEWSSTDGEVRLAMVLNTDSNFDRRAFRSAARGITQLADRYLAELERLGRSND